MKALGCLVAGVIAVGCGSRTVDLTIEGSFLTEGEAEALARGIYPAPPNAVLLTIDPDDYTTDALRRAAGGKRLKVRQFTMRNPGVMVMLVEGADGSALTEEFSRDLIARAREVGFAATTEIKVKRVYGPDGVTPMVMPGVNRVVNPDGKDKLTGVSTTLILPTVHAAKEAIRYIDPKGYACSVDAGGKNRKPRLIARLLLDPELGWNEWEAFEPLASRFGGTVEFVTTESEGPVQYVGAK